MMLPEDNKSIKYTQSKDRNAFIPIKANKKRYLWHKIANKTVNRRGKTDNKLPKTYPA